MRLHAGLLWGEEVPASALPSIQRLQGVLPEEVVLETHSYFSPSCFGREQATGDMASLTRFSEWVLLSKSSINQLHHTRYFAVADMEGNFLK